MQGGCGRDVSKETKYHVKRDLFEVSSFRTNVCTKSEMRVYSQTLIPHPQLSSPLLPPPTSEPFPNLVWRGVESVMQTEVEAPVCVCLCVCARACVYVYVCVVHILMQSGNGVCVCACA